MAEVHLDVLSRVGVASPCSVSWEDMTGDARVRHCDQCSMNVYNLSEMTAEEAAALVMAREGRLCVRFYRREDGTMLTRDCPVGLRAVRVRAARVVVRVGAAAALLLTAATTFGDRKEERRLRVTEPFAAIARWLNPTPASLAPLTPPNRSFVMGDMCMPPMPAPAPTPSK